LSGRTSIPLIALIKRSSVPSGALRANPTAWRAVSSASNNASDYRACDREIAVAPSVYAAFFKRLRQLLIVD
jgi:hypothetical protein